MNILKPITRVLLIKILSLGKFKENLMSEKKKKIVNSAVANKRLQLKILICKFCTLYKPIFG